MELLRQYRWRRLVSKFAASRESPSAQPVVIGALGGSGTRPLVKILRHAGVWMGDRTDPDTEDALAIRAFLAHWFEPVFTALDRGIKVSRDAKRAFRIAIRLHRMHAPEADAPWGWKNPRSMWLIPFFVGFFPNLKFIHILRDGRDMALSDNKFLLTTHGDALLGERWRSNPLRAQLALWEKGNTFARNSAERFLDKDNYLMIRYEDLCVSPLPTIWRMLAFADAAHPQALASECDELVIPSRRIGSWKTAAQPEVHDLDPGVSAALDAFGYTDR